MRGRVIPLIVCLALLGALTAVAVGQVGTPSPARAAAVRSTGAFEISNSVAGEPIFAAAGLAPGASARGRVTIEDSGSVPTALRLERGGLTDSAGIGGGVLSSHLQLTVTDVTRSGAPRSIYSGPLASMPPREAGELDPGDTRTYEFVATLPDGAPSEQNALQGASTTVAYSWVAEEASGEAETPSAEGPDAEAPGGGGAGGTDTRTAPPGGGGGVAGVAATLDLTVPRIAPKVGRRGLLAFVDCDATCRILVRGRLRASADGHRRTAKIHLGPKRAYTPGAKKLRIPIPRAMRGWLRRMPPPKRLQAKLRFVAVGTAGGRDVVKKKVRLRVRRP